MLLADEIDVDYEPEVDLHGPIPTYIIHKKAAVRSVVGITCSFSVLGSFLIIISYLLFRDLRTNARLILLHLSLADFGVAASNLFGIVFQFERFYNSSLSADSTLETLLSPKWADDLCKAEAFIAHFTTISSVLWTMTLAAYMYTVVRKLNTADKDGKWFMRGSYVICYGLTLLVNVWMMTTNKLGYSPYDTSGWCGTVIHRIVLGKLHMDYMSVVLGYDIWIILTMVFIIVIYLSLHFYVKQEKKNSEDFQELIYNVDYKFIAIPVAFVLLRLGSLIHNILTVYGHGHISEGRPIHMILGYAIGIGDSGQGAVNAVLFVLFTRSVRRKIFLCCCWCFTKRKPRPTNQPEESVDSMDDSDAMDESSPMRIAYKSQKAHNGHNGHMGSMASTTSVTSSPSRYYDSLSSYEPKHNEY